MWAAQTFVNIAQLTTLEALWNWGFPSHHTLPLQSCLFHLKGYRSALLGECNPYWGQASSHKQSRCGRYGLSNILKLQATFLYSIYHQRAGKTNLFYIRGISCWEYVMYLLKLQSQITASPKKRWSLLDWTWASTWGHEDHDYLPYITLKGFLGSFQLYLII